jgi:hypothetical protein
VIVTAHDDEYGFVDGWRGRVIGWDQGYAIVKSKNPDDQEVTLYVPPQQLTLNVGGSA